MFYDGRNDFSDDEDFRDRGMDFQDTKPSGPSHTEGGVEEDGGNYKMKKKISKKDKGKAKHKASKRTGHLKKLAAKEEAKSSFDSPTRTERQHQEAEFSPSSPESPLEPETFWQEAVPEPDLSPRSPQRDPSGSFQRGTGSESGTDETRSNGRKCPLSPSDYGPKQPSRTVSPVPIEDSHEAIILNTFVEDDNDDDDDDGRCGIVHDDLTISTDEAKELCKGNDDEDGIVSESNQGSRRASMDSQTFSGDSTFDEAFTTGSERSSSSSYEEKSLASSGSESGDSSYEERSIRDMEEGRNQNEMVHCVIDPQQRRKMTLTLIAVIISWALVGVITGGIVGTILKG